MGMPWSWMGEWSVRKVPHTAEYISPLGDVAEVEPGLLQRIEEWFRPHFVLLGWRDAPEAGEWIGACRAAAAATQPKGQHGGGETR
jgi:hypothetical protein